MQKLIRAFLCLLIALTLSCGSVDFNELLEWPSGSDDEPSGSAPAEPTGVTATPDNAQVLVQWKAVSGASSYNLYWSEARGVSPATGTKIAGVSSPYTHTGRTNGATYYYIVTAVNQYGESGASAEVTAILNGSPALALPTGVSAVAGDSKVVVTWNAVDQATGYNIYWSHATGVSSSTGTKIDNVSSPYVHNGLGNGSPYYYVVTAYNEYGESGNSQEVSAIPRADLSNSRVRVVWVQDVGDGRDVFAQGSNLRLMGTDTADGQGERVILGTVGSYAKPLITPKGDRVVYSDRIQKKVYAVNWDGTGLREVLGGFGLALWRDPKDGQEWLYYGAIEGKDGDEYCQAVYRVLLDNPKSPELVWNRTSVSVHNFQLSTDGLMAGGLFPYPNGGIARLANQSWIKLGSGCWTGLSPDNTYTFWIFDEAHSNLFLTNASGGQGRSININGAPGINGYEVYHPRWGNHPRIMTMTGPYTVASGVNRIAGGGQGVEVYVGLIDANFTVIESWWQVTNNERADFFPDVWAGP